MQVDLSGVESLIPPIAQALGVEPATALLGAVVVATAANIGGRLIPDDKKGPLGFLRKVLKVIGLYTGNRVASGISTNDVAKAVVKNQVESIVQDHAMDLAEEVLDRVIPPFPGNLRN